MTEEVKKKVAGWIGECCTVGEIHRRLNNECGVHLTRLETRILISNLENPLSGRVSREEPKAIMTLLEKRLREGQFERNIASRVPVTLRWLLFLPVGLIAGIAAFVTVLLLFSMVPDEDVVCFGGMGAGLLAGSATVLLGMMVAPHKAELVALIMGVASVILSAVLVTLAWTLHDFANRLALIIGIGIYCCCTVIASLVCGKPSIFERLYGPSRNQREMQREAIR